MEKQIAKHLLDIEAVFLNVEQPFTWASGIKSPIYCDNRLVLSNVEARNDVEIVLARLIRETYPEVDVIVGTATAGIAHAAIVAHLLNKPNAYVRSSSKGHGRQNQIEGKIEAKQKVVVVEDLISTGQSVIEVVKVLQENDIEVLGVVSIFTYQMQKGFDNFKEANMTYHSLTNLNTLLDVAVSFSYISKEEQQQILKFIKDPNDESWMLK